MNGVDYLINSLLEDEIILVDDQEIVQYGLDNLKGIVSGFVLTLTVGYCFGSVWTGLFLWLLLVPLRKHAGGYHAATKSKCFFSSTVTLIILFVFLYLVHWPYLIYGVVTVCFGSFVFLMAPVGNKSLDISERRVYRKRTRYVLILESILFIFAMLVNWWQVVSAIAMGFASAGMSLVMGVIKESKSK